MATDHALGKRDTTSPGTPCWVESFQPNPRAATEFYGSLFGWTFDEATPMPTGLDGEYFTARLDGRRVAGIGQAPPSTPAGWVVHVRVDDIAETLARAEHAGGTPLIGPLTAGSDGQFALLADATGVPFCVWQSGDRNGAEVVDEPNSWAMSSLHTTDLERANAFYGNLFGWELASVPGAGFAQWRRGDRLVAVVTATDGIAVPPHWSINFAISDVDDFAARAVTLGGSILMPPTNSPGFRNAVVADPQGGVVAVSARPAV
ncbi:VOC family protein [Antrihabitans stalactiti]|uniref:VOC family protein n=1 Tax=Antrihabitans stalactiti TaxID=2584121 RepID=A0A848KNE9_9NOCA|nr:VOC family protein [Antrihabitans stalactiti]